MATWDWEKVDVSRSGSSGDVSKLFKNENIKRPGILSVDAPPADATIMAREVIQNSWDAAHDLRHILGEEESPPDFDIDFRFRRYEGDALGRLDTACGITELGERARSLRDRWTEIGLHEHNAFHQAQLSAMDALIIEEHGASGMYGPWSGTNSKMYLAMVSIGFTEKLSGSGGSYGYGKAGLIRGSRTRTVIAYSCFPEDPQDPGVTRRFLGMTYWGPHDTDLGSFTGFSRFGERTDDGVVPFENDEADAIAHELGLDVRDPEGDAEEFGTTFLLLDPAVAAGHLRQAVERNWWPAIQSDHTFGVEIRDYDGEVHVPKPRQLPELQPFIRGFEICTMPQDNSVEGERRFDFQPLTVEDESLGLGTLGLVSDVDDWSYPGVDENVEHRSLVALIRSPRMVVEYLDAGQARPYVRGAFVAHQAVDELLRQTEPRGHDAWQTAPGDDSIDHRAPEVAKAILGRIRTNVGRFRRDLKPPLPDRREIRLPELEKLFSTVLEGEGNKKAAPPPPPPRMVSIQVHEQEPEVDPADPERIRLRVKTSFALSENFEEADEAEVRLGLRCRFLEDNRAGEDCPIHIEWPTGFESVDEHYAHGRLARDPLFVEAVSESYRPDWSTRVVAEGELRTEEDEDEQ